eukprot:14270406-Alexandrium_andersonii.AAC.1
MRELAGGKPHREQTRLRKHAFNLSVDRLVEARTWPGRRQRDRRLCEAEIAPVRGAFVCKLRGCACN